MRGRFTATFFYTNTIISMQSCRMPLNTNAIYQMNNSLYYKLGFNYYVVLFFIIIFSFITYCLRQCNAVLIVYKNLSTN